LRFANELYVQASFGKGYGPMRFLGLLGLLCLIACGGAEAPRPELPPAQAPPAAASPPPAPATPPISGGEAGAAATSGSAHDQDGPDGVRRWKSWDGPTEGPPIGTPKAWVMAPNTIGGSDTKPSFSSVAPRVGEVASSDAKETIVRESWGQFAVPASVARLAQPAVGLKKGATALCAFGGSSVVARVEAVDAKSVTCAFSFMDQPRREKLAPDEVLPLDGALDFGAPAHARFDDAPDDWYEGFVVAASGDQIWVSLATQFADGDPRAGRSVHKLAAADVRAAEITRPLKVGEACLATEIANLAPCKVKKVLDGGLGYSVSFEAGSPRDFPFDRVSRRPKGG
jgi:hypothetical protein